MLVNLVCFVWQSLYLFLGGIPLEDEPGGSMERLEGTQPGF